MKILIDADMFAFIACSGVEREIDWGNDVWTLHADFQEAKGHFEANLNESIEKALEKMQYTGAFDVLFCFSDKENFRKKILPTYKANRVGKRKPCCYRALVDWVSENYDTYQKPCLEADDCIGILSTIKANRGKTLIISGDKDMKSLPGYHYDFLRDEFSDISEEEADHWFYMQTLMGDSTDGYSGCPGIGAVGAERLLTDVAHADVWNVIIGAFSKKKLSEAEALQQARCARILRASDYDFKNKKVKLWSFNADHS